MPVEQARKVLGDLVAKAQLAGRITIITRYGQDAAAIVPMSLVPQEVPMLATDITATITRPADEHASGWDWADAATSAWLDAAKAAGSTAELHSTEVDDVNLQAAIVRDGGDLYALEVREDDVVAVYLYNQLNRAQDLADEQLADTITMQDLRDQITRSLTDQARGIDVEAVAETIRDKFGVVDIDTIDDDEYWEIVRSHDATQVASTITTYERTEDEVGETIPTERIVITRDGDEVRETFTSGGEILSDGVAYSDTNPAEYLRRRGQELTGDGYREV